MPLPSVHPIYDALALPADALDNGGLEILRVGVIEDELYVTARRAFQDPSIWGQVLADVARRIAALHSAEDTRLTEKGILASIEQAFAADLGAPAIKDKPRATRKRLARAGARRAAGARRKPAKRRAR